MGSVNKVILIGNLGKDPEVRMTQGGQCVANFSIATSDNWKDKEGQKQERTEWHRIVAWGRLGELARDYLKKGRPVYIEGRLQTRSWQDQSGQTRYTTEIVANVIQFLGSRGDESRSETASTGTSYDAPSPAALGATEGPSFDDDVPF